jgi:hypothetical protein
MSRTKKISGVHNHKKSNVLFMFAVPAMAIAGLFVNILPSQAVINFSRNDYRICAAQLLKAGVTAQAASQGCAKAIRPRELSSCVADITKRTEITPSDAFSSCRQARRPKDLATCVVDISINTQQAINQATLNHCERSLLPVKFAECVVGLRQEIDLDPMLSLNTCIDANDKSVTLEPGSLTSK